MPKPYRYRGPKNCDAYPTKKNSTIASLPQGDAPPPPTPHPDSSETTIQSPELTVISLRFLPRRPSTAARGKASSWKAWTTPHWPSGGRWRWRAPAWRPGGAPPRPPRPPPHPPRLLQPRCSRRRPWAPSRASHPPSQRLIQWRSIPPHPHCCYYYQNVFFPDRLFWIMEQEIFFFFPRGLY